jgi:prepilin-type N-terminal cleavage/methylation domain-containing protein
VGFADWRTGTGRAFTLLEVLTTVALLSLAASVALVGLSGLIDAQKRGDLGKLPLRVDGEARLLAVERGPCRLVALDGPRPAIILRSSSTGETLRRWSLPNGAIVGFAAIAGSALPSVRFDGAGRTSSYVLRIRLADRLTRVRFQGDTGWATMQAEAAEWEDVP